MKRLFLSLNLLICFTLLSYSQGGEGCCPDYNANLTVVGCELEVCFSSTFGKRACPNETFYVQIHNQDNDLVFSSVINDLCFTFTGTVPGDTYTVSGNVYPDPIPIECNPPAQIIPASLTIPEDCDCCPTLAVTVDVNSCDMIVCWEIENPDVEWCDEETVVQLAFERTDGFHIQIFQFGAGDDCFTWSDAIPGGTYAVGVRIVQSYGCIDPVGTWVTETMPEDCGCCPDLTSTVDIEDCVANICVSPLNTGEEFCEDGFTSILIYIRDDQGDIVEIFTTTEECFTWTEGEAGQTYSVSGRIDYVYDCDDGGLDLLPVDFTIPEDCDVECLPPWNILCNELPGNDISVSWEGPSNASHYIVEISEHIENVSCCEEPVNPWQTTFTTTSTSIPSMEAVADLNCLVLRITTVCEDGTTLSSDWICFFFGHWRCNIPLDGSTDEVELRKNTNEIDKIIAYPNPVTDVLRLEGENLQTGYSVSIFSLEGEFISKDFISDEKFYSQDVSRLIPGKYVAKVNSSDGKTIEQVRFIKM